MGIPPSGLEGVPPCWVWMGYPPPISQSSRASTCYAVGSMPLAFMQDDFLLLLFVVFFAPIFILLFNFLMYLDPNTKIDIAWKQEAYRPPRSKCLLCCPVSWWEGVTPSSPGQGGYPIQSWVEGTLGWETPPFLPRPGMGYLPAQTWDGVPPWPGNGVPPIGRMGTIPPHKCEQTTWYLWKHYLPSSFGCGR